MTKVSDAELRDKMIMAIVSRWKKSRYERVKCPSIRSMAEYIERNFKDVTVKYERVDNVYKHTKSEGSRILTGGGTREYSGGRIVVTHKTEHYENPRYAHELKKLLDHDSTETYRDNREVAGWILEHEGINPYDYSVEYVEDGDNMKHVLVKKV